MEFEWDEAKRIQAIEKHGVDFADAPFLWSSPMVVAGDNRKDYGEPRFIALGKLKGRVMVVVYTYRGAGVVRIISFRKANSREVKAYESALRSR